MQIERNTKRKPKVFDFVLPKCSLTYKKLVQIERNTKWKPKVFDFVLPKCSLTYEKLVQIERNTKRKPKVFDFVLPKCSLTYKKLVQIERNTKWKPKVFDFVLPKCSLTYEKLVQITYFSLARVFLYIYLYSSHLLFLRQFNPEKSYSWKFMAPWWTFLTNPKREAQIKNTKSPIVLQWVFAKPWAISITYIVAIFYLPNSVASPS